MTTTEKLAMLEELFEIEEGTLEADALLADIPEYDSMTRLSLIVLMEDEFDVKLDGAAIKQFETVQDILDLME